tara:strand:+ start:394 stop:2466 length:2073 start_codon:yes stop_codon:yes gene_type:complete
MIIDLEFKNALELHRSGKLEHAKKICLKILKNQNHFETLHLLSSIYFINSNYKEALQTTDQAIKLKPDRADIYTNKGAIFHKFKKFKLAIECYDKAIKIKPDYAPAYNNKGITLEKLLKLDNALECYDKAIKIKSDYAQAYNNRGNVLFKLKKNKEAINSFNKAVTINKNLFGAFYNRGIAFEDSNNYEEAIKSYEQAIKINPNYIEAYNNKANLLVKYKKLNQAKENYKLAHKINPNLDFLLGSLFFVENSLCDWENYKNNLKLLEKKMFMNKKISPPFNFLSFSDSPQLQKQCSEVWVKEKFLIDKQYSNINKKINKKIHIGYYSYDFYDHPVSYLLANVFESHDKSKFKLIAFDFGNEIKDDMKNRISKPFDKFINVSKLSNKDVIKLSKEFNIDIAVDLMGFTTNNRFEIFSKKCAPIQVNFLGYPGTLGSNCIDYLVADKVIIPEEDQKYYSEKIIYLPDTYQANDPTKKISDKVYTKKELGISDNCFVYCCFNKHYKISPYIFDLWMEILSKVDNSVLWLFEGEKLVVKNLKSEAEKRGVNSNRLIFAKFKPSPEHLARHRLADLFIDTFPYTAHTTCSDALYAGLPVLTLKGKSFVSRVAASLLSAIDLNDMVMSTKNEFKNKAIELAKNPELLKKIKIKLEKNKFSKPLFNSKVYTKNIEKVYIDINSRYLKNLPPKNIKII